MTDTGFDISPVFADAGVSVTLGVLEADVEVSEGDADLARAMDEAAAQRTRALEDGTAADVPEIAATRRAYKALGKDPSRYRPSAEALLRRVVQGKGLFRVNNVVDVNNLISLATGHCAGAYDLAHLRPPVILRPGNNGESYEAIGRGPINLHNLPLLADADGAFGSPTSDSERSMVRPDTGRLLMVIYGFGADVSMDGALDFASERLEFHCSAQKIERQMLNF